MKIYNIISQSFKPQITKNKVTHNSNLNIHYNPSNLKKDMVSFGKSKNYGQNSVLKKAIEVFNKYGINYQTDEDGMIILSEYHQPSHTYDLKKKVTFTDLGIDENEMFKYVKEIKGDADFRFSQLTNMGNLECIGGNADFTYSKINSTGNLKYIGGNADFEYSKIKSLGNIQSINGYANFEYSNVKKLGKLETIGDWVRFRNSDITNLGNLQYIGGNAWFDYSEVKNLGNLKSIEGNAYISQQHCNISKDNLKNICKGKIIIKKSHL